MEIVLAVVAVLSLAGFSQATYLAVSTKKQGESIAGLRKEVEALSEEVTRNSSHVDRWLEDIPRFYAEFPGQIKQEMRMELRPTLDLILEDLQALKKREFWSAHAQAVAVAPDGLSRLTSSVAEMVGRGDLSAALDTLSTLARNREEQHEVLLIRYRYSSIRDKEREGVEGPEAIAMEKRAIASAILSASSTFGSDK